MRENKVRAWHKTEKKMYDWSPLDGLQDFDSLWNLLDGGLDQYVVMLFTGLTDKNGKEIYEYDVIQYYYCNKYHARLVYWSGERCGFHPFCHPIDYEEVHIDTNTVEIIGNKYQDRHLIKELT